MATTTAIPLSISPEATARVRQLGMEREFEMMLEHTRQTVPSLRRIEVIEYDDPEIDPTGSRVIIMAWKDEPPVVGDPTDRLWGRWQMDTFSPDIFRWFDFEAIPWEYYGR